MKKQTLKSILPKMGTKPDLYGWYGCGFACYKGNELHEYPHFDDKDGWFEFLDGYGHAYADYSIGSSQTFEDSLKDILGFLIYDEIVDILKEWDQR